VAVGSRKYQELMVSASLVGKGQGGWGTMTSMYVHIPYDSQQPTKRISCQTPQSWLHKPRCTGERSLPPELGWPGETQTRSGRLTGAPHLSPVLQETSRLGWSAATWSPTLPPHPQLCRSPPPSSCHPFLCPSPICCFDCQQVHGQPGDAQYRGMGLQFPYLPLHCTSPPIRARAPR
jgi:hypothetical protein